MDTKERDAQQIKRDIHNMLWFVFEDMKELEAFVVGEDDRHHGLYSAQADWHTLKDSIKKIKLAE